MFDKDERRIVYKPSFAAAFVKTMAAKRKGLRRSKTFFAEKATAVEECDTTDDDGSTAAKCKSFYVRYSIRPI